MSTIYGNALIIPSMEVGTVVSVQDTKALTITSNGTVSVTPDAPYDALKKVGVTVNVASGGGGGAGINVTFPATSTCWDKVDSTSVLFLADGTQKSIADYSSISGQTVENVIGIGCISTESIYILRMTLSKGSMVSIVSGGVYPVPRVNIAPGMTNTYYSAGQKTLWWPLADTVISAIEMYNTD